VAALVVGLVGLAASCSSGASKAAKKPGPTTAIAPPDVQRAEGEWPLPGRDYRNSRSRSDTVFTAANVGQLKEAWAVPLPGVAAYGSASTTPVILDGVAYVQDLQSNVYAVDVVTGRTRWTHRYQLFQIGPNGAAVGYGRVYVAKGSDTIAALDAKTGDEVWSTKVTTSASEGVDIQPTVAAGLVLVATVPISLKGQYKGGDHGVLWALDAKTGEEVWSFDTVKDDLWGNAEVNSGGGAWYPPAVDVDRGLVYWGIANPAPFPGTPEFPNGSSRPGANLYTDSLVALHVRTGKLAWYHQVTPHDLFDRDLVLTAMTDGEGGAPLLVATGKAGRVVALDPETHQVVSDAPVGEHRNDELTKLDGPTTVLPGSFGGVETPPAVYDGVAYTSVVNAPSDYEPGKSNHLGNAKIGTMQGTVAAVELRSGKVLWSTRVEGDPLGGALVLNDLVFTGSFQGTITVLDRKTGRIVRTFAARGGINGWPAATRDTLLWPIGNGKQPALVAFRVDGSG
jgi:glucose dehydrogenase